MKSDAEYKRDERQRMRDAGFGLLHAWVHKEDRESVVRYINAVSKRRNSAK